MVEGNCLEVLPQLPDGAVVHTLTDPPYGEHVYARTRTNKGSGFLADGVTPITGDHGASRFAMAAKAIGSIDEILEVTVAHVVRLTSRWMLVFSCIETAHRWRDGMGDGYVRTGAWGKTNPMPQVSGDRPGTGFEPCTIGHGPTRLRWNGGGRSALWLHANEDPRTRPDHPCPKPIALMVDLVTDFTDPGELVLDPFTGSGTTGVACLRLGRRFLGVEKSPKYAALARERLEAESKGLTLRDARHGQLPLLVPG